MSGSVFFPVDNGLKQDASTPNIFPDPFLGVEPESQQVMTQTFYVNLDIKISPSEFAKM